MARKLLNLDKPPTLGVSQTERGSTSFRIETDWPTNPKVRPAVREFAEGVLAASPGRL